MKSLLTFSFANILGSSPNGDENFVENKALLSYSKLSEGAEAVKPGSMAVSEYHFLLLMGNKVKVCCAECLCYIFTYDDLFCQIVKYSYTFGIHRFSLPPPPPPGAKTSWF